MKTRGGGSPISKVSRRANKRERSVSLQPIEKSKKYLVKRFNNDFKESLRMQGIEDNVINYFNANQILIEMGYIFSQNNTESNEERILFVDLWRCLKGDEKEGVKTKNLKLFLLAIEGLIASTLQPEENKEIGDDVIQYSPCRKGSGSKPRYLNNHCYSACF